MRDGYLRGALPTQATQRQMDVLAAYVAAGGSVQDAAELVGIRPSTVKRHLADLRARSGLRTEQLIYAGRAGGWLVVPSLEGGSFRVLGPRRTRPPLNGGGGSRSRGASQR
jgi:DNA-binding CsgD family transcriptional regulator